MHFESLWITFTLAVSLKQILTGNSQFFQIRLCVWGPAKPQLIESDRQAVSWGTNFTLGTRRVDAMPFVSAIFVHHATCLATCSTSGDPVVSCPWVQGVRSARQTRNDFGHLWKIWTISWWSSPDSSATGHHLDSELDLFAGQDGAFPLPIGLLQNLGGEVSRPEIMEKPTDVPLNPLKPLNIRSLNIFFQNFPWVNQKLESSGHMLFPFF